MTDKKITTVYISDAHLGTDVSSSQQLFKYLKTFEVEDRYSIRELVLVGDIIDFTSMRGRNCWSDKHTAVIQKFLRMARKGVKVTYISGNHDFHLEFLNGTNYGNIHICKEYTKLTNKSEKVLVKHGHQYDALIFKSKVFYHVGDFLYEVLVKLNKWNNIARWLVGKESWSLSMWLKSQVKAAISFVGNVEERLAEEARHNLCSVAIYGHTHISGDKVVDNVRILNCGCFTEYSSCVLEYDDGSFEVKQITAEELIS